jgi:hypothetical protein
MTLEKLVVHRTSHAADAAAVPDRGSNAELVSALLVLARALPPGSSVPVPRETLLKLLEPRLSGDHTISGEPLAPPTWRERIWTCPAETRLGVRDVAEALKRPVSWVYRAVSLWCYSKANDGTRLKTRRLDAPLPHERLSGELVFRAGRVREWIESSSC